MRDVDTPVGLGRVADGERKVSWRWGGGVMRQKRQRGARQHVRIWGAAAEGAGRVQGLGHSAEVV